MQARIKPMFRDLFVLMKRKYLREPDLMTLFRPANPAIFLFAALSCFAQGPAFDVASVRPSSNAANGLNQLNDGREPNHTSPESLTIRGASLRICIQWAYDIPPFQIEGPAWLKDSGFDIVAKAAEPVDDDHMRLMLRTLLATRFGLKAHSERKEMQVYELTLDKGGPKLHESTTEGPPMFSSPGKGALVAERATMSDFAGNISEALGRPVMDATGLKGRYDIHMDATAYMATSGDGPMDATGFLFNALQQQLGVKLESRKNTPEILVAWTASKKRRPKVEPVRQPPTTHYRGCATNTNTPPTTMASSRQPVLPFAAAQFPGGWSIARSRSARWVGLEKTSSKRGLAGFNLYAPQSVEAIG